MHVDFELNAPDDLAGTLDLLAQGGAGVAALAGGTNLIVDMRAGRHRPQRVVALSRVQALRGIDCQGTPISIGGGTTVSDLLHAPGMASAAPSLVEAANCFAGQMVRNTATVAGNIACGSPAADLVPPLLSLDASVTLARKAGERSVPLEQYFQGYKKDVRRADELITRISWPRLPARSRNAFYKLARRSGDAITITGVAVTLCVENGLCAKARIALGAVAPVVMRAKKAEALLTGARLTPAIIGAAAREAAGECSPIDDIRASAQYRRHTVEVLTRRLVSQAWEALTQKEG
ncbi:MAG: FAD binding domain-containing protein [Burkholderiales bacterium]|nr:FAD binding domain-containing protein [Burkholderiales bacterium]